MKYLAIILGVLAIQNVQAECIDYSGTYKSDSYTMRVQQTNCDVINITYTSEVVGSIVYNHHYTSAGNIERIDTQSLMGRYVWKILPDSLKFTHLEFYNKNDPQNIVHLLLTEELKKLPDGNIEQTLWFYNLNRDQADEAKSIYTKIQ